MGAEGARRALCRRISQAKGQRNRNPADFLFAISFIPEPPILSVTFLFSKTERKKKNG
jgi:hypothetical protein